MLLDQELLVRAAGELEPLPNTVTRLAAILAQPGWDIREVEEVISLDQALTPRLLRLANSALAARSHPVATVRDAVLRIGTGPVFSMAVALGVQKRMRRALPQFGLREGELWKHSVAAALAVETMGVARKMKLPVESFTAALLHDIGKLVMARFLDAERLALLEKAEGEGGMSRRAAEKSVLGVDHGELGGLIGRHWKLPERLTRGIQFHHAPDEGEGDAICSIVHLADVVAKRVAAQQAGVELAVSDAADGSALEETSLTERDVVALSALVSERLAEVLSRYS